VDDTRLIEAAGAGVPLDLRAAGDPALDAAALARVVTGSAVAQRAVVVRGALVTGRLSLESARLACPLLLHACRFEAPIDLSRARALDVALIDCEIPGGIAADGLDIDGDLDLSGSALPLLTANGACISGNLVLDGVRLAGGTWPLDLGPDALRSQAPSVTGSGSAAIRAEGLKVGGTASCRRLEVSAGEVQLAGARLGELNLWGAALENAAGPALCGDRMTIAGSVLCRARFSAHGADPGGAVSLRDAKVGGGLNVSQATLINDSGPALLADGAEIEGSMLCRDMVARGAGEAGALRLTAASIGAELQMDGAALANASGPALAGERLRVGAGLSFAPSPREDDRPRAFRAEGAVRLAGAAVTGPVSFDGARVPDGASLAHASVSGRLSLRFAQAPAALDLRGASLGALRDSPGSWPPALALRGCTYGDLIRQEDESLADRIGWVRRGAADGDALPSPQPYEQLRAFFRGHGDESAAREVAIAALEARRVALHPAGRAWSEFLRWTVGYGYRTWQAAIWLVGLVLGGWLVFSLAWAAHMHPLKSEGLPPFHASLYALDVVLPVVDFGQQGNWVPTGLALAWYVFSILAGWVLVTAVLGALTAALVRD